MNSLLVVNINNMRLNAPKRSVFYITIVLALLGLLGALNVVPMLAGSTAFWLVSAGYVVLALANIFKGM